MIIIQIHLVFDGGLAKGVEILKHWLGPLCLSAAAAIWGGMYVVSKVVLACIPSWILLEWRFVIALFILGLWALRKREWRVKPGDLWLFALIGLVGYTGSIGLQFIGTHLSGAAMGSLITSASPALISLFAWWILKEKLNLSKTSALLLATIGVLIVSDLTGLTASSPSFAGNLALIGAALTWALYTVLSRLKTVTYTSLTVTFWANTFGVIFTAPFFVWEYRNHPFTVPHSLWIWIGILYIGIISTALAFYLWNKGFEYADAATGSLFFFIQPIVGSLLGAFTLGEKLSWNFYLGALLIAGGIYLSALKKSDKRHSLSKMM
ncbi:DMT family transporter [Thermoactinomyces sp. CICC 10523]|nr:DMT family transporter [Thermoactinomyces sp. CICC 10523]